MEFGFEFVLGAAAAIVLLYIILLIIAVPISIIGAIAEGDKKPKPPKPSVPAAGLKWCHQIGQKLGYTAAQVDEALCKDPAKAMSFLEDRYAITFGQRPAAYSPPSFRDTFWRKL